MLQEGWGGGDLEGQSKKAAVPSPTPHGSDSPCPLLAFVPVLPSYLPNIGRFKETFRHHI